MMTTDPDDYQRLLEEDERRVRRIRQMVDIACAGLATGMLTPDGARDLIADIRRRVLALAPDGAAQFDLIYAPRLRRIARGSAGSDVND
jgi:hypothetical protein